jgi:hypothetical protein
MGVWDGSQLMAEYDGTGSRIKRYAYLPDDYLAAQMEDAHGIYNIQGDHLHMPRLLTNATQQVVWLARYEAFGKAIIDENSDGNGQGGSATVHAV